jgi:tetratricopeptide (TPR) repeat protein
MKFSSTFVCLVVTCLSVGGNSAIAQTAIANPPCSSGKEPECVCPPVAPTLPSECLPAGFNLDDRFDRALEPFSSQILPYIATDQYDKITELMEATTDEKAKVGIFLFSLSVANHDGQPSAGQVKFFSQAMQMADYFKQPELKAWLLVMSAQQLVAANQPEEAQTKLATAMETIEKIADQEVRENFLGDIAQVSASLGQLDQALKIVNRISDSEEKDQTLDEIIEQQVEAKQFQQALALANKLRNQDSKMFTLVNIAYRYNLNGQTQEALELLAQALPLAKQSKDDQYKGEGIGAIALEYARAGQAEKALEILGMIDSDRRSSEADDLADYYLEQNNYAQFMKVVGIMNDQETIGFTMSNLAQKYTDIGQYDQVLKIANSLGKQGRARKFEILSNLALKYARNGDKQKALDLFDTVIKEAQQVGDANDFATIATTYYEAIGDRQKATLMIDQAWQKAKIIDQNLRKTDQDLARPDADFNFGSVASAYSDIGAYDKTLQVIQQLRESQSLNGDQEFFIKHVLTSSAQQSLKAGEFAKALQFVNAVQDTQEKEKTLKALAIQAVAAKQFEQAIQFAQAIADPGEQAQILQILECAKSKSQAAP